MAFDALANSFFAEDPKNRWMQEVSVNAECPNTDRSVTVLAEAEGELAQFF